MTEYLAMVGFLVAGFVLMALALQFSKYKQSDCGCSGHCSTDHVDTNARTDLS
ncbi:MAG: hypothetical protein GWP06_11175 [Actinobacteria bacterium]|nr:hypothetical protein [Actinomycetota bacterium]